MNFEHVTLHNVAATASIGAGRELRRLPEDTRGELNDLAKWQYRRPAGVEIRFIQDGPVDITLSASQERERETDIEHASGEVAVEVFRGPFDARQRTTVGTEPQTITVPEPAEQLEGLDPDVAADLRFDPAVCRLLFRGDPLVLHEIDGETREPEDEDVPDQRLLTYGTSITQGVAATREHLTYARQTARHLGADLLNLGTGGSCYCETAIGDHLATRDDWDRAILALSVNMMKPFTVDEFRERAREVVEAVAATGRPVTAVTLYPSFYDLCPERGLENDAEAFRDALREIVIDVPGDVQLVEGPDVLRDIGELTTDLIHPGDNGMVDMGRALAQRLDDGSSSESFI
ncbi:SGNH/GDSL hydrolase family protein [Haloarcula marina]|uniref:SGNH/GDSL hydrolase family protein n=1 Tax=Haloarcula marina TaxID=2961574 RepID=UPI0020B73443|nr:SGNH/GDSL hydrolase family protein [Halomicroarcula marina]